MARLVVSIVLYTLVKQKKNVITRFKDCSKRNESKKASVSEADQ